jgi:hypothetical protein
MAGVTVTDALKKALFAVIRSERPGIDYLAHYQAKVVGQSADRSTVDVHPEHPRLAPMSKVPLKLGIPGTTAKIEPGALVVVGWADGDPQKPEAYLFGKGATTVVLSITAGKVELGGEGLRPLLDQIVIGATKCQFTGAPHAALGPLSSIGFAKE